MADDFDAPIPDFESYRRRCCSTRPPSSGSSPAPKAQPLLSLASAWELAIESSLGRVTLAELLDTYLAKKLATNLRLLSVELSHVVAVERLPFTTRTRSTVCWWPRRSLSGCRS